MSLVARSTTESSQVPYEMLEAVFSYLDVYDLLDAAHTCSRWKEVVNSSEVLLAAAASEVGSTAIAGPCCTGEPSLKGSSIESKSCHRAAQEGGDGSVA